MVGKGVGGGSSRSSEEEAGGGLLELIAKAMTPHHSSGSGRCIGYGWARHGIVSRGE
jgi:hypothetical protein